MNCLMFHKHLVYKLRQHSEFINGQNVLTTKNARSVLGRTHNIPRSIQVAVLKDLEHLKLIKQQGKRKIIILLQESTIVKQEE